MTLTPSSPPPLSPHVSFPQSAFRPVIPAQDTCTDQLQQQTPLQPSFNPNQLPPPTFAPGLLPTMPHLQNQISPRVLCPHSLNRAFYNLSPYEEYPYQNFSGHTFVPQNTTQTIENQATGESTNVESTHAKLSKNSQQQQNKLNTNITSVDTQVQTGMSRPKAQTVAYDTLLNKANDERMKKSKQEKGIQAEGSGLPPGSPATKSPCDG